MTQVRSDPKAVLKLRCLFLKLRSMLELPLLRIGQDKSPAAARVGDFYSASLLTYVRKVLQVCCVGQAHSISTSPVMGL
jgi:WASH complex subunit strumpellin